MTSREELDKMKEEVLLSEQLCELKKQLNTLMDEPVTGESRNKKIQEFQVLCDELDRLDPHRSDQSAEQSFIFYLKLGRENFIYDYPKELMKVHEYLIQRGWFLYRH